MGGMAESFDDLLNSLLLDTKVTSAVSSQKISLLDEIRALKENTDAADPAFDALSERLRLAAAGMEARLLNDPVGWRTDVDYRIDYRQQLNEAQLKAVCFTEKPLLIIAGAGTGKTRTLIYKVAYLMERGMDPHRILLLTFTRKAANEMLERVQLLLGKDAVSAFLGGTFHAFANYVLRKYHHLLAIRPNFSILDTEDSADIISLLKTELNLGPKKGGKHFPKSALIQDVLSKARNLEMTVEETVLQYYPEQEKHLPALLLLDRAFSAYKQRSALFDYDDLLLHLRNALRDNVTFRKHLQKQFDYMLVDEYQDTNSVQGDVVAFLGDGISGLTVVGDDAQSIYAFRGANIENILRFSEVFPSSAVVKLEQNYRSDQSVLNFTNDIVRSARFGFHKELFSLQEGGDLPEVMRFPDATEEAIYIVDRIVQGRESGLEYKDFAVLTRAAWQSNFIQTELMKRDVPFVVVGGIKFSERRHVKDMIAFLRIYLNPLDAVAWHRILKLTDGIGSVRAREIIQRIHTNRGDIATADFSGIRGIVQVEALFQLFTSLTTLEQNGPALLIEKIYGYYLPVLKLLEDDYEQRKIDLNIFMQIAEQYQEVEKFITDFTLEPPSNRYQDGTVELNEPEEKPVVISTIHSAKGLEWHSVFIPFALDGLLPSARSMGSALELEEERRLFYVAASRAKKQLAISMPAYVSSWDAIFTKPCRFLAAIGEKNFSA